MNRRYLLPLVGWLAVVILATLIEGAPRPLPGLALGSILLLHCLRVAALFGVGVIIGTVLVHASAGRLPTQLSTTGLAYDAEATSETTAALLALQEQLDDHQLVLDRLAEQLDRRPQTT
jgi:hypothetical protein